MGERSDNDNNQRHSQPQGRRKLLRVAGAGLASLPFIGTINAPAQTQSTATPPSTSNAMSLPVVRNQRVLGSGAFQMEVSALGFGVMGMSYNRGFHPERDAMIALLHQAVERGVSLFDTAQVYGPLINEELAGEALSPFRNKVKITTKFGHRIVDGKYIDGELDNSPKNIRRAAEESLKRLRVDAIDLFYLHRLDPAVPIEEIAYTVKDLIRDGKVKRFGLCEVSPQNIRRAHAVQPVTAVQSEYHLMWREQEKEVFPVLQELGIGFVSYSPLNRGFLGGGITEYARFDASNDNRATLPRFVPEAIRANLALVEKLNSFGKTRGITSAQIALAWMMAKAPWIVPIPGTTKIAHLDENLRAGDIAFPPADVQELEAAVSQIQIVGDRYPASLQKQVGS